MGYSSFGTLLKMGDGASPETFTTIAEVLDIKGPELEADTEDITNHSSPNAWSESIVTILNSGEVSFEVNYLPADATHNYATGLLKNFVNRTLKNWKLVFPNPTATTWSFSGYVTSFSPNAPVKGVLKSEIKIKITGQLTLV